MMPTRNVVPIEGEAVCWTCGRGHYGSNAKAWALNHARTAYNEGTFGGRTYHAVRVTEHHTTIFNRQNG